MNVRCFYCFSCYCCFLTMDRDPLDMMWKERRRSPSDSPHPSSGPCLMMTSPYFQVFRQKARVSTLTSLSHPIVNFAGTPLARDSKHTRNPAPGHLLRCSLPWATCISVDSCKHRFYWPWALPPAPAVHSRHSSQSNETWDLLMSLLISMQWLPVFAKNNSQRA